MNARENISNNSSISEATYSMTNLKCLTCIVKNVQNNWVTLNKLQEIKRWKVGKGRAKNSKCLTAPFAPSNILVTRNYI